MLPTTSPHAVPVYVRDAARPQRLDRAADDLITGFRRWRLAWALARLDIRNRYRGSVLGPFWLTLSTAIMIAGLGLLYSTLFKLPLVDYLPFVAVSLLFWNTINQIVSESCVSLVSSEGIIRQVPLPFTIHALRCVFRNSVSAAHSLPLIILVFAVCGAVPRLDALLVLPGMALVALNAFSASLFLGMICARFRDIAQIVTSSMQFIFFVTPVIWKPELLAEKAVWLPLNPVYVVMETMRGPLLGAGPSGVIWACAVLYTAVAVGAALAFFVRFRHRIAFWV